MAMQGGLGIFAIVAGIAIIVFWSPGDSGFENIFLGGLFILAGLALMASGNERKQTTTTSQIPQDRILMHQTRQQTENVTETLDERDHLTRKIETETMQKKTEIEEK